MGEKKLQRVMRTGNLGPDEVTKDEEIRRKVQEEFPPACTISHPTPDSLSEILKQAIRESDRSIQEISRDAGVSQIMVEAFLSDRRDISTATADRLASVLGLKLKVG